MLVLRAIIILCVPVIIDASIWGNWGSCSKTCGIGTQIRQRINSAGNVLESEKQYCNTQPCPVLKTCRYRWDCPNYASAECRNNTCHCTGHSAGKGFNTFSCFPQQGNCAILKNPPTAIGYKDPSVTYPGSYDYPLYSCTTNDNPKYEVHVVSLKGNYREVIYKISIVPRGPVVKPIILVLTSELWEGSTQWMIETPVGINKVLYGGSSNPSTVGKQKSSKCEFRAFQRLDWIKKTGYGREEYTSELLRSITEDFGPITSFTGYYQLSDKLVFRIILHVGGNPLQVIPFRDTYMVSSNCTEGILDCPLMNQQLSSPSGVQKGSWTQWSSCTKTCNIGTQTRCRYNKTLQKIEYEEQYCNTQYCPGEDLSCNMTTDCPRQAGWSYNIECKNHVCRCSLGDGHNKFNCFGEVGNCVIREKSQTALGYAPLESYLELKSCTTNDNTRYELHVISTFGGPNDVFEITIKPRGPVIKPIILVLMSDLSIIWKIDTPVGLYKVLYGGRDYGNRTVVKVVKNSSSKCSFEATKRSDIAHNINNDVKVLTKLSYEFGPITSYTRLFPISDASWITLEVGGSPLQVLTRDYRYDASQLSCESPTPPPPQS